MFFYKCFLYSNVCDQDILKAKKEFLRDVPNWTNAPVPICMGGDYRALTFCCKPGHSLTFGYKCLRDEKLKEIGLSSKEFMNIKEKFSEDHNWNNNESCFGSLAYCCMRRNGCNRRDLAMARRYPGKTFEEALWEYFGLKKELAQILLSKAKNQDIIKPYL